MDLVGKLFWIILYIVFTFAFVVLFEHGPDNYVQNAKRTFDAVVLQIKHPDNARSR